MWLCKKHHAEWHAKNPKVEGDPGMVLIEITRNARQQLKVLASLEAITMAEYLKWMVDRAWEATTINRGRKVPVKAK